MNLHRNDSLQSIAFFWNPMLLALAGWQDWVWLDREKCELASRCVLFTLNSESLLLS